MTLMNLSAKAYTIANSTSCHIIWQTYVQNIRDIKVLYCIVLYCIALHRNKYVTYIKYLALMAFNADMTTAPCAGVLHEGKFCTKESSAWRKVALLSWVSMSSSVSVSYSDLLVYLCLFFILAGVFQIFYICSCFSSLNLFFNFFSCPLCFRFSAMHLCFDCSLFWQINTCGRKGFKCGR